MAATYALTCADYGGLVAWIAPTYRNSRPLWRMAERLIAPVAHRLNVRRAEREIEFPSGGALFVYSADNPDAVRGMSFDVVIVDEAARVSEEAWQDAIQPTLADRAGRAMLISTPVGRNWFYTEWQRASQDGQYSAAWRAPTSDNPIQAIKDAAERAREIVSERTYRQEWLAEFVDDGGLIFRNVRACATAEPQTAPQDGHTYVAGLDWAFSTDYTVLTVIDATTKAVAHIDRFNGIDYAVQRERIAATLDRFKVSACVAESNSMGRPNNEMLHAQNYFIQQVETTNATKAKQVEDLASAFERGNIAIPNNATLIAELESYEGERLPSGMTRYSAPQGMHDDMVMSLALAWQAAITGSQVWL